jgi:RHS repeat-associated protein
LPFGEEIPASFGVRAAIGGYGATDGVKQRFTGKERDLESGLDYFGARYFSGPQGRFTTADAVFLYDEHLVDPQQWNRYAYVRNNPLKYVDPTGNAIETPWDVLNVGMDAASLVANVSSGNVGGAVVDVVSLAYDLFATAVPGLPAGAGTLVKASRVADKTVDAFQTADKIGDAVRAGDKIGDAVKGADAAKDLHRPYVRTSTRQAVEGAARRTPEGKFIDPNTGKVIEGRYDLGHKRGNEFRREKAKAKEQGLAQKQFNDRMNDPNKYQIEDPCSNRSHCYEQKP